MVAQDLIVVWLNNRPTLWRWDAATDGYAYLRNLTEEERRLVENGDPDEVMQRAGNETIPTFGDYTL